MKNSKRQKNMIIGGLLAIVFVMAIGYAAFAQQLTINGSGSISSNWSVKITNITSKDIVGTAGKKTAPTYTDTTATFATTLQSPGDSITYDITVTNEGTLDAQLDKITITNSNNPAITFETSGLTEGSSVLKGTSEILSVKVTYDNNVTSQPGTLTADLKVTLDFSQKTVSSGDSGGSSGGGSSETMNGTVYAFNENIVTIGTSTLTDLGTSYATFAEAAASNSYSRGVIALKYTVENNVLTEGYACFLKGGTEYCLKGYDTNAFANNVAILNTAFPTCGASASYSDADCDDGSVDAYAHSLGDVTATSDSSHWNCSVRSGGDADCAYW